MAKGSDKKPVGYASPPVATRFKPGKSGNQKGRPKKLSTFAEDVLDELNQPHHVNATVVVTRQRAIIMALVAQAIDGDTRAVGALMRFFPKDEERQEEPQQRDLSPGQQALLHELVAEEIANQKPKELDDNDKTEEDDQDNNQQDNGKD